MQVAAALYRFLGQSIIVLAYRSLLGTLLDKVAKNRLVT
jgi:hypothetical protein